jgi:uncharacterized protein YxeA
MPKKIFIIIGSILILIFTAIFIVWRNYATSPEYNYVTAKIDIRNDNIRVVNLVDSIIPYKEKEIQTIASKYGFKNVYPGKVTSNEMKGIKNYNEIIEMYLNVRNGSDWRHNYQKEIDSLHGLIPSK